MRQPERQTYRDIERYRQCQTETETSNVRLRQRDRQGQIHTVTERQKETIIARLIHREIGQTETGRDRQ